MRVVVSQFEGIDATPSLPLAAGCLIATARLDPRLAGTSMSIALVRRPIAEAVADYGHVDVLGFSLYPWNVKYSLAVARAARAAHPRALLVAGGPTVPRRPEQARRFLDDNPAIDVLVMSEGELAFRELLAAHLDRRPFEGIDGIAVAEGPWSPHYVYAPPQRVLDFAETGSPYLDGTFDEVIARHANRFSMAVIETNRGCPFSCTFCDWSLTKHVVERDIAQVRAELDWAAARALPIVCFADANFGIRPRDSDIARHVAQLRTKTGAPRSVYFYLTKNDHARNLETIEILQAADVGCWVGLAVQDFDDHVLASVKRDNIGSGESMKLREICSKRDIPTMNELIFGLPGQTYDSFTHTVARAMPSLPRHDFVLYLCRMLDNSELASPESRAKFGIETRNCQWKTSAFDWDPIVDERQEIVVATRDLPLAQWKRTYRFAFTAAALYNLRLLRVVLHHVSRCGLDLRDYVEHLADHTALAPRDSVYADLGAVLDRYLESILSEGPMVLLLTADAPAPSTVEAALAVTALARYDEFLAETLEASRDSFDVPNLDRAFEYQSLITPRHGQSDAIVARLDHDWPKYVAAGESAVALENRPTTIRYVPPAYTSVASFHSFATTHVSCIGAKVDVGTVEEYDPRHLYVLPASG